MTDTGNAVFWFTICTALAGILIVALLLYME